MTSIQNKKEESERISKELEKLKKQQSQLDTSIKMTQSRLNVGAIKAKRKQDTRTKILIGGAMKKWIAGDEKKLAALRAILTKNLAAHDLKYHKKHADWLWPVVKAPDKNKKISDIEPEDNEK